MLEQSWVIYVAATFLILICFSLTKAIFSPLARIPGPFYSIFTDLWLMRQEFTSSRRLYIHQLHKEYGSVVRLGPNEVSFTSLEASKEIYASGGSGYDKTEFYTLFMQFGARWVLSPWLDNLGLIIIAVLTFQKKDYVLYSLERWCESSLRSCGRRCICYQNQATDLMFSIAKRKGILLVNMPIRISCAPK